MKILLAGDSWGIGVFSGKGETYKPIGQGIHTILADLGHSVINISKPGCANWLLIDRLENRWDDTGTCLFGVDPADKKEFNLKNIDHIIFLQTDIFRERHYFDTEYPGDPKGYRKLLEKKFVDELLDYRTLNEFINKYFNDFYTKLNSIGQTYNKKILCAGGWGQLHPNINQYNNLIPVIPSITKLLIPNLLEDCYISDPEWITQLSDNSKIMKKFPVEFKKLAIDNANKLNIIWRYWNDCHPKIEGYRQVVDKFLPYLV
jgi:hypothetical protein